MQLLSDETCMQAAAGEGVHAAVLCGAEAQPGSGGACCSLFHHQGKLPLQSVQQSGLEVQHG